MWLKPLEVPPFLSLRGFPTMQNYCVAFSVLVYYILLVTWLLSDKSEAIRSNFNGKSGNLQSRILQGSREIEADFSTKYTGQVSASSTDIYHFNYTRLENETDAIRVKITSSSVNDKYPLLVVIKQQLGVQSWQIPTFVEKIYPYWTTSRTLCPTINYKSEALDNTTMLKGTVYQNIYIDLSSASPNTVDYTLRAYQIDDFFIETNVPKQLTVTPSQPQYVEYKMPEGVERVLVSLQTLEPQKFCSYFSVQSVECPVADLESDLRIEGVYETVTSRGAIVVTRSQFSRFYIVVTVKPIDYYCQKLETLFDPQNHTHSYDRVKIVELLVTETLRTKGYLIGILGLVGFFMGFYVVTCLLLASNIVKWKYLVGRDVGASAEKKAEDPAVESTSKVLEVLAGEDMEGKPIPEKSGEHADKATGHGPGSSSGSSTPSTVVRRRDSDSSLESEVDFVDDVEDDKNIVRAKAVLYIDDLTRKTRKRLSKKDRQYRWSMITICIFYGLPVIQLVITSQRVLKDTGNDDLCYYNFDCANPLWIFSDFNHIFSNLGYVLLGLLFILLVRRRQLQRIRMRKENPPVEGEAERGVPPQFELFYAMALALIMEGLMSASYHICPSYSNFQFDTSFMYLIAGLGMLKIYQKRHADVLPNAYMAYAFFAFIILMALLGVVFANIYVWVIFSVALICISLILSAQIYLLGRWRLNWGLFHRILQHYRVHGFVSRPAHIDRFVLLLMVIAINWSLAIAGPLSQPMDFASYMLSCFVCNFLMYVLFYIIMKLVNHERISRLTILFMLVATAGWGGSLYLFFQGPVDWQLTPSRSREVNKACFLLKFYDQHDVWHMVSAVSLFFSFMVMLTLDDDLLNTHRTEIPVF